MRAREARDVRERDHLERVREKKRERELERNRERERVHELEAMQSMSLGGNALNVGAQGTSAAAGVAGKVGRHASVGRKHLGGGQLRPLNMQNVPVGFYDTTLS